MRGTLDISSLEDSMGEMRPRLVFAHPSDLLDDEPLDALSKPRDGRGLEEVPQGELDAEDVARAQHELRPQQRVAAEIEEVVVDPHVLDAEELGHELRQAPL